MKFQSEKKELWRYASKNLAAPVRGTTKLQPLPHRLPHQRLPQRERLERMERERERMAASAGCCDAYAESSTSTSTSMRPQVSTPPPPYSPVAEMDCIQPQDYRLMFRQHQAFTTDGETETSLSTTDSDTGYVRRQGPNNGGYSYANTGDIMHVDDYEKLNESSSCSSTYQLTKDHLQRRVEQRATSQRRMTSRSSTQAQTTTNPALAPPSPPSPTAAMTSFAATAAKILRNCCGGGFGSSNSVVASHLNLSATNNNNTTTTSCTKQNYENSKKSDAVSPFQPELHFNALMKQLKASQITSLLKAVKSRHDQVQIMPVTTAAAAGSPSPSSAAAAAATTRSCMTTTTYQTNCILMRRAEILGEEPHVIVCRLFLWRDLKNSSQLKRLPVCPTERDPVYVCCNPLHWCRILETESAPPPYRSQMMDRNEGLSFQNYGNSTSFGSSDADGISSIRKTNSDLYVRISESLTTDGQESRCSPSWCEVAYWELAQRVGERFPAETPTINIFSEKPYNNANGPVEGMCLKDLIEKRTTPSPDDVQYTRQKIGLGESSELLLCTTLHLGYSQALSYRCIRGVTLSQEFDGVWLYNRSTVPIFVYSPTLTESWFRVCRVEPGDCLRAFDKYRAQSLVYSDQFPGVQTGPIDKFSMRISFGKGWGCSYKRPDVTRCPCWLEVLFRPQR